VAERKHLKSGRANNGAFYGYGYYRLLNGNRQNTLLESESMGQHGPEVTETALIKLPLAEDILLHRAITCFQKSCVYNSGWQSDIHR